MSSQSSTEDGVRPPYPGPLSISTAQNNPQRVFPSSSSSPASASYTTASHLPASSPSASSSTTTGRMIGATYSFYNPDDPDVQQPPPQMQDYDRWVENYQNAEQQQYAYQQQQQQQQHQNMHTSNRGGLAHANPPAPFVFPPTGSSTFVTGNSHHHHPSQHSQQASTGASGVTVQEPYLSRPHLHSSSTVNISQSQPLSAGSTNSSSSAHNPAGITSPPMSSYPYQQQQSYFSANMDPTSPPYSSPPGLIPQPHQQHQQHHQQAQFPPNSTTFSSYEQQPLTPMSAPAGMNAWSNDGAQDILMSSGNGGQHHPPQQQGRRHPAISVSPTIPSVIGSGDPGTGHAGGGGLGSNSAKRRSNAPVYNAPSGQYTSPPPAPQRPTSTGKAQSQQQQRKRQRPNPSPTPPASGAKRGRGGAGGKARAPANARGTADESDGADDDYEDDEDDGQLESPNYSGMISVGMGGMGVGSSNYPSGRQNAGASGGRRGSRLPGACTHCKRLKMRCEFPKNGDTCNRCKGSGHPCIVEGRKPRTAPNKREYLLAQIRQKDNIIESLLKQLHNPYTATPMSIASFRMATSPSDENNKDILNWLDLLRSSLRTNASGAGNSGSGGGQGSSLSPGGAGGSGIGTRGPGAFGPDTMRGGNGADEDSDHESPNDNQPNHRLAELYNLKEDDNEDDSAVRDGDDDGAGGVDSADVDGLASGQGGVDEKLQQNLPEETVPLGLIANLSLDDVKASKGNRRQDGAGAQAAIDEGLDDDNVGVANKTYFLPGPATDLSIRAMMIEQHSPPEILVHGLVSPADVSKLFEIFYERLNPFISLLDPVLHTPASTFARCPFLFTVICAISSRYYSEKAEIYPIAMHFAKHSAANALIDGWKSVELCQAYILMSIWAVPAKRWEEDRSWLYTGLAIRIATDLNLHQPTTTKPVSERHEREMLNKTRVWMICFNLDRSTATQFGKPLTIREDYVMRNHKDWHSRSENNHKYDVHLCAYTALLRIVARFHDEIFSDQTSPSGLNQQLDFKAVSLRYDAELSAYHEEWDHIFKTVSDPNDDGSAFRCKLLPFLVAYSRLVMWSFGFQKAFKSGIQSADEIFFVKSREAAQEVVKVMIESLAPSGYMRYAPDGHFVFASFASAFLLKLLRLELRNFLTKEQETDIFDLIASLIRTLSSPEIAIDDRHTPKLYARFLAGLLSRCRYDGATIGRLHPLPPPSNEISTTFSSHSMSSLPLPSTSTFSVAPPQTPSGPSGQSSSGIQGGGYHNFVFEPAKYPPQPQPLQHQFEKLGGGAPVYKQHDTSFSVTTNPIIFGNSEIVEFNGSVSDEDMLATMQALKNPEWWENMMMPGFSWPPNGSPIMTSDYSDASPTNYRYPPDITSRV